MLNDCKWLVTCNQLVPKRLSTLKVPEGAQATTTQLEALGVTKSLPGPMSSTAPVKSKSLKPRVPSSISVQGADDVQVTRKWLDWEGEGVPRHIAQSFAAMEADPRFTSRSD